MKLFARYRKSLLDLYNKIITEEIYISVITLAVLVVFVITPTLISGKYSEPSFFENMLASANAMVFDLLVFGVLVAWFSKIGEKRREVQQYMNEIDDFRDWPEQVAAHRIRGNIRRLNQSGVSQMNLKKCYLVDANLENVKLSGSELWKANFAKCDLENGQLDGCDMWSTDFTNAILRNVNLSFSKIDDAVFTNADLSDANFKNASLTGVNFENANLANAILDNADLTGAKGLNPIQLSKVKSVINIKIDEKLLNQAKKINQTLVDK
jgi:uncharacterized protein YjbI with pentapeptide repeats